MNVQLFRLYLIEVNSIFTVNNLQTFKQMWHVTLKTKIQFLFPSPKNTSILIFPGVSSWFSIKPCLRHPDHMPLLPSCWHQKHNFRPTRFVMTSLLLWSVNADVKLIFRKYEVLTPVKCFRASSLILSCLLLPLLERRKWRASGSRRRRGVRPSPSSRRASVSTDNRVVQGRLHPGSAGVLTLALWSLCHAGGPFLWQIWPLRTLEHHLAKGP